MLPFVLAYQIIEPLVSGSTVATELVTSRAAGVLLCLVAQALLYGWGLNVSHNAAYGTLLRLRTSLQKKFENLPLGVIQDKGTGTVRSSSSMTSTASRCFSPIRCRRAWRIS